MSNLADDLKKELKKEFDIDICLEKMKNLNDEFHKRFLEILNNGEYESLGDLLKEYAKLRRTIAKLEKGGNEFVYECGIFNGSLNLTEEIYCGQKHSEEMKDLNLEA